jgi:hypothetical protein
MLINGLRAHDHATMQEVVELLCAVLLGGSATDLLRRSHVIATSRTQIRVAATRNFMERSAPRPRQLSGNSVGRL